MTNPLPVPPSVPHPHPRPAPPPDYYVPLPRPLLVALRDTPLAIGVYALIARVYRATRQPVPLSAGDVARYDPSISRYAADRALDRLIAAGYVEVSTALGRRRVYRPAWGRVQQHLCRWELAAPSLGRPRHIAWVELPQRLLDAYLGRLEPDAQRGAHVTRYTTQPLLGLTDVGAYALAAIGAAPGTDALVQHGLIRDGTPQPPPPLSTILAAASQRRLLDAESPVALTAAGWRQLGVQVEPRVMAAQGQLLVFVPVELCASPSGTLSGDLSGSAAELQAPFSASPRLRGRVVPVLSRSQGGEGAEGTEISPTHSPARSFGGGRDHTHDPETNTLGAPHAVPTPIPAPDSTEGRLLQLGVRRDVARQLADRPLTQIERVIAQARAHQGVRNLAAWVVSALRALPAAEETAPPQPRVSETPILLHPGLSGRDRQQWLARFRRAHPVDRPAVLARFHAEHPLEHAHAHAA